MNKNRFKRIMAYVYMPLFFLLLGYGIVYIAFKPYIEMASSLSRLVISSEDYSRPTSGLTSIFDPALAEDIEVAGVDQIDASAASVPGYEEQFGQISCGRIELYAPLYYGDSTAALDAGAGMYMGSLMPGFGGTILVGGHNHTYFKPFENLEIGDIITIQTNYGIYEYEVTKMEVRDHRDRDAFDLLQMDQEVLVAYTCYPFTAITELTDDRLFVTAEKISGPEVTGLYG